MAFLRRLTQTINGTDYTHWYWCIRRRSRKKSGGDGSVKSWDLPIGHSLDNRKVMYYAAIGELTAKKYATEIAKHYRRHNSINLEWSPDGFPIVTGDRFVQREVEAGYAAANYDRLVMMAAQSIADYDRAIQSAEEWRQRESLGNEWIIDDGLRASQAAAELHWQQYRSFVDRVVEAAPLNARRTIEAKVVGDIERQARVGL